MEQREIKFRAWDEKNKTMHYDFQCIKSGEESIDWIIFTSDKQPINSNWKENPYFSQQLKIMQYTGLKLPVRENGFDNKGNWKQELEIYEGDIVEFIGGTCNYLKCGIYADQVYKIGDKMIVQSLKSGFTLAGLNMKDCDIANRVGKVNNYDFWNHHNSLKIIGNIYETSELLK